MDRSVNAKDCLKLFGLTLAALAIGLCDPEPSSAAPIPTSPVFTNKTKFRIPFRYDAAELQSLGAREIRLLVSRDRGLTWTPVQTVSPEAGKFSFQAPSDGEYWFVVKTLDAQNRQHPDGNADPGLQVIVDTTVPRLDLLLRQTAPGRVQLSWAATDTNIDPTQLRLEYTQPGVTNWQPVSIVPKSSGQTEWSVPQGGLVSVQGAIGDLAKNTVQAQAQTRIAPGNEAVPRQGVPDLRQPIAAPSAVGGSNVAMSLPNQFIPANTNSATGSIDPFQSPNPNSLNAAAAVQAPANASRNSFTSASVGIGASPTTTTSGWTGTAPAGADRVPRVNQAYRIVNTRQFQIGYKIQDVGPSGVSSVDLFITEDNGGHWFRYGADEDHQSPFSVEVPREGTYGFSIGVKSGAGLTSDPPQAGDKPSIVVVVDQTSPQIDMLPLEQGRGRDANKILMQWRISEAHPADKPISLSFAANRQGPWQPITGWTEDSGRYVWTVGPGMPSKFFLRMEARDAAGNMQVVETPQPVLIDLSRPTAKIIDIESGDVPLTPQQ
jgi:hypothetical protein